MIILNMVNSKFHLIQSFFEIFATDWSNSLTDQVRAKYEQLDSEEYGTVDTPAFKAKACELAHLLTCESQLCQKLNLPPPKVLYRPTLSTEDTFWF